MNLISKIGAFVCIGFPAGGFAGLCRDLVEVRAWNQLGVGGGELVHGICACGCDGSDDVFSSA